MTSHDYTRHLAAAIATAQAAGDLLRADFDRPGGPAGGGSHADADDAAEALIRARLLAEFPGYGYLGEETGFSAAAPAEAHLWLIDPNDGTRCYLRGERGSAVSIALLCDGVPVLGVVFAFAAPDHAGDLIAWAEGCGPVTRNGTALPPAIWPATLSGDDLVLVSAAADSASADNAALCAPARFLAVPSIAYRLALVAAGVGVAGVSLNGPVGWDYGAGHALLRGAGGTLVDEGGREVVYSRDGHSRVGDCFGGGAQACAQLARRPWRQLRGHKAQSETFDLVSPLKGQSVTDPGLLSRAQGCLLGQVCGDALGSLVEFQSPGQIARRYPDGGPHRMHDGGAWNTLAGQPTDDSELALILARCMVAQGGWQREPVAQAYRSWLASGPFDVGFSVGRALSGIRDVDVARQCAADAAEQAANPAGAANGALMRCCPIGIWGAALSDVPGDPAQSADATIAAAARADARLTHPNPTCQDANAAFAIAVAYAVRTGAAAPAVHAHALAWAEANACADVVADLRAAATAAPADFLTLQGWVRIALQNAFFQLLHAPSAQAGVVDTVRRGGDTDTTAAIAGALLGAVHGRDAWPAQWRGAVLSCRPIQATAALLEAGVAAPKPAHVRPRAFWPVDAMVLAERLVLVGLPV